MQRLTGRLRGIYNRAIDAVLQQLNESWNTDLRRGRIFRGQIRRGAR